MYQHPGVYIEHVPSNALAIEAASTSVTAFVGHARRGTAVTKSAGDPIFISSVAQYNSMFGPGDGSAGGVKKLPKEAGKSVPDKFGLAVNAYFANGGTKAYIVPVEGTGGAQASVKIQVGTGAEAAKKNMTLTETEKGTWANGLLVQLLGNEATADFEIRIGTYSLDTDGTTKKMDTVLESFPGLSMKKADQPAMKAAIDAASSFGWGAHTGPATTRPAPRGTSSGSGTERSRASRSPTASPAASTWTGAAAGTGFG